MFVYVGAYTESPLGRAEGISLFQLDAGSGELSLVQTVGDVISPSFLALSADGRFLYAVSETDEGHVCAYARDVETGALTALNSQPSEGASPCYISLDRSGRWVLVANYTGETVATFPRAENGELGEVACVVRHQGSSVTPRQQGPHPHMISPTPDGRFVFATDLGTDRVMIYELDATSGQLRPNTAGPAFAELTPGSGPRHFVFAPNGRFVYVINELSSTLTVFAYDDATGTLDPVQTVPTVPEDFTGETTCAHVAISPDGRTLYGSNRGHDSLAIWTVSASDGTLSPAGHASTQGQTPRNFALDPTATWLLAANQDSDSIITYRRDAKTGALTVAGPLTATPSPVAILFAAAPGD